MTLFAWNLYALKTSFLHKKKSTRELQSKILRICSTSLSVWIIFDQATIRTVHFEIGVSTFFETFEKAENLRIRFNVNFSFLANLLFKS